MLDFLSSMLPKNGTYCIAIPAGSGYSQRAFTDLVEACEFCRINAPTKDVFFAIGSLKNAYDGANKVRRTSENIDKIQVFILDIDVKEGGEKGCYTSQKEAAQQLGQFCKKLNLPRPTMVVSGGGIHAYFRLDEPMDAREWRVHAKRLKELCVEHGLNADPARTADISSVLRVVETINHKLPDNKRKVFLVGDIQPPVANSAFISAVGSNEVKVAEEAEFDAVPELPEGMEPVDMSGGYSESQFSAIIEVCGAMSYAYTYPELLNEPQWRGALSIAKFCEDSEEATAQVSDRPPLEGHTINRPIAYNSKMASIPKPLTCEVLKGYFPDQCEGCKNVCKSPISLGTEKHARDEFVRQSNAANAIENYPLMTDCVPHPFYIADDGVYHPPQEGLEDTRPTKVTNGKFYPYSRLWCDASSKESILFVYHTRHDGIREVIVANDELMDQKSFIKVVSKAGILISGKERQQMGHHYAISFSQALQNAGAATKAKTQLGWIDNNTAFVTPTTIYRQGGIKEAAIMNPSIRGATDSFRKRGELSEWVKVVDTYAQAGYEKYAFAHSTGYGSLLMAFTQYSGATINLKGDSGSGKSTIQRTINSIWGHPTEPMLAKMDTLNSRMSRLGIFGSVAVCMDEITNMDVDELSDICYAVTEGRDKGRLNADSSQKANKTWWKLLMITSSNSSVISKLASGKSDSSPEMLRVMEIVINSKNDSTIQQANSRFMPLMNNYGHAGEVFVEYVVDNIQECQQLFNEFSEKIDRLANITVQERYWSTIAAVTLTGAMIARRLGLNNFNIEAMQTWVVQHIIGMRGGVADNKKDGRAILVEFLSENINNTLRATGGELDARGRAVPFIVQPYDEPKGMLIVRNEVDRGLIYIARGFIRNWITKRGGDPNAVRKELMSIGVMVNDKAQKVLSAGSNLKTGQVDCWCINSRHEKMDGLIQLNLVSQKSENALQGTLAKV